MKPGTKEQSNTYESKRCKPMLPLDIKKKKRKEKKKKSHKNKQGCLIK